MAYIVFSLTCEKMKRYGISRKNTLYFAFQLDVGEKIQTVLSSCLTFPLGIDKLRMVSCVSFTIQVSSDKTSVISHEISIAHRENLLVLREEDNTCKNFWYSL